jgi:hypothetical protein
MAANLNKIADKVRDNSKENIKHTVKKPKQSKMKSKGSLAHRPTGRPPFMAWAEQESIKERQFPQCAQVSCEVCKFAKLK